MVAVCHSLQGMVIQYACSGPKNATAYKLHDKNKEKGGNGKGKGKERLP